MRNLLKKIVKTINQATKLEWMDDTAKCDTNGKKHGRLFNRRTGIKWHDLSLKEGVRYM